VSLPLSKKISVSLPIEKLPISLLAKKLSVSLVCVKWAYKLPYYCHARSTSE
jgi:hypothetical protein